MTDLDLPHVYSGKVRDIYDAGDGRLLMVTSDRISAFDVVMAEPIPDKGRVLTAMSAFWFEQLADVVRQPPDLHRPGRPAPPAARPTPTWPGRVMLVPPGRDAADRVHRPRLPHRLGLEGVPQRRAPCTARRCPPGLLESAQLPEPVFTPSTKADDGTTTRTSRFDAGRRARRRRRWPSRRATCRSSSTSGAPSWAAERGIIIADTKFELGLVDGELVLCRRGADARLVAASGRPTRWEPGATPPSFDKQPVRDFLERLDWDKTPPPPPLPAEVVAATSRPATSRPTSASPGASFADWPGAGG